MKSDLKNAALSYCNFRFLITGVLSILIALSLGVFAVHLTTSEDSDTNNYIEITGLVKDSFVEPHTYRRKENNTIYKEKVYRVFVTYTSKVNGKPYLSEKYQHGSDFDFEESAKKNATNAIGQTRKLFYNPNNPSKTVTQKNAEDVIAGFISSFALFLLIVGVISIVFRNNPIFCGIGIANDAMNLVK